MTTASVRYVGLQEFGIGLKPVLGVRGRKYASCVVIDENFVRVVQVDLKDFDKSAPVLYHGQPYPVERFAKHMLNQSRASAKREVTKGAAEVIEKALRGEEVDEAPPSPEKPSQPSARAEGVLASICRELSIEPSAARRVLRAAGMKAPYEDATAIRQALKE